MTTTRASLVLTVVFGAVVLFSAQSCAVDTPSYALTPWPYGAIAWVDGVPDNCQLHTNIITQALRSVFDFWNVPLPDPMQGWEDPSHIEPAWKTGQLGGPIPQAVKKNPATNQLWRLNPLQWNNIAVYPMLYIAFPSWTLLEEAFGSKIIGGLFLAGHAALHGSEVWFQTITGGPMSIAAPYAGDNREISCHEFTHWMMHLLCLRSHISDGDLPRFIVEGLAEYTAGSIVGITEWNERAFTWAQGHHLSDEQMGGYDVYYVGASFVQYLVDQEGKSTFLRQLPKWAEEPEVLIRQYRDAWCKWLLARAQLAP